MQRMHPLPCRPLPCCARPRHAARSRSIQKKGVSRKTPHRRRPLKDQAVLPVHTDRAPVFLCVVPRVATATAVGAVVANLIAPTVARARTHPRRVFPLRLTGQAVGLARLRAQPGRVGFGVLQFTKITGLRPRPQPISPGLHRHLTGHRETLRPPRCGYDRLRDRSWPWRLSLRPVSTNNLTFLVKSHF